MQQGQWPFTPHGEAEPPTSTRVRTEHRPYGPSGTRLGRVLSFMPFLSPLHLGTPVSSCERRRILSALVAALVVTAGAVAVVILSMGRVPEPHLAMNPDAEVEEFDGFTDGDPSVLTATSTFEGSIELTNRRAFRGSLSTRAQVRSPDGYSYSRVQDAVHWQEGDDVWYGAAIYLEPGFKRAQGDGSVDILRWDNWAEHPRETDHGGLAVLSTGELGLISEQLGVTPWTMLLGPYDIPEGEWVWLEVRQRFSERDGEAINEVWMDGEQLGANLQANYFGRPITRHRVGIIGTPDPQPGELKLYLDHVVIARNGPVIELQRPAREPWRWLHRWQDSNG